MKLYWYVGSIVWQSFALIAFIINSPDFSWWQLIFLVLILAGLPAAIVNAIHAYKSEVSLPRPVEVKK